MDARAGFGVGRLFELAVALVVTRVRGLDRRPARAPARAEMDVRSISRPSRGAPLAMLLIVAAATALSGCAPAAPPTTGATSPAAPAGPVAEPPPATAQPPQTPASDPVPQVVAASRAVR